jgi:hypothetical protein
MNANDKLIMELATPSNPDEAARMLRHPLAQALEFCEARAAQGDEFYRRLAGSIRKAHQMEIDNGRA